MQLCRLYTAQGHLTKVSAGIEIQPIFAFQDLHPDLRCPDMCAFSNSSTQSGPFVKSEQKYLISKWEPWPLSTILQTTLLFKNPFSLGHLFISLFFSTRLYHQFQSCHGQRATLRNTAKWGKEIMVSLPYWVAHYLIVWELRVQCGSHWSHVTTEHMQCGSSELRGAVSVEYILDFKDLVRKKEC